MKDIFGIAIGLMVLGAMCAVPCLVLIIICRFLGISNV